MVCKEDLKVKLFILFLILLSSMLFGRFRWNIEVCFCFCCLTIKDVVEEALVRIRGTRQFYIRHVSNAEREILDILQNFEPEKEEPVTVLASFRDRLRDKLDKIKATDDIFLPFLDRNELEKELDYI